MAGVTRWDYYIARGDGVLVELGRQGWELVAVVLAEADDLPLVALPHVEFKHLSATAKATIRTADTTPYANIIIVSG